MCAVCSMPALHRVLVDVPGFSEGWTRFKKNADYQQAAYTTHTHTHTGPWGRLSEAVPGANRQPEAVFRLATEAGARFYSVCRDHSGPPWFVGSDRKSPFGSSRFQHEAREESLKTQARWRP